MGVVVAGVLVLAACSGGGSRPVSSPTVGVAGSRVGLDVVVPGDAEFFGRLRIRAHWLPEPEGLAAGVRASTLVLTARVKGVRPTRTIGTGGGALNYIGVVLEPIEVLHGAKVAGLDDIVVEFDDPTVTDTAGFVKQLSASLPEGPAVWFLYWKATGEPATPPPGSHYRPESKLYYRLTHPFGGLVLQGRDGLTTPLADSDGSEVPPGRGSLNRDVHKHTKLSALAEAVKGQGG
ncbi:hypothetical protein GCM10027589_12650 [Actinocorallia lasiicapitis]